MCVVPSGRQLFSLSQGTRMRAQTQDWGVTTATIVMCILCEEIVRLLITAPQRYGLSPALGSHCHVGYGSGLPESLEVTWAACLSGALRTD